MKTKLEARLGAAWITMDDGKVNAMSVDLLEEIAARLDEAEAAAVTVLSGRPGVFSAGFDLNVFKQGPVASAEMVTAGVKLILKLLGHPRPVLALCTGHAYPMGAFLLLCADVRIGVAGDARIGLNEPAIGIDIPQFAVELARWRLAPFASSRLQTAKMLAPERAREAGYLDEVVAPSELLSAALSEVERLAALDRASFAASKARIVQPALDAIAAAFPAAA